VPTTVSISTVTLSSELISDTDGAIGEVEHDSDVELVHEAVRQTLLMMPVLAVKVRSVAAKLTPLIVILVEPLVTPFIRLVIVTVGLSNENAGRVLPTRASTTT
jgi:hypothetical protein